MTVAEVLEILQGMPQDLQVYVTNGDLPDVPAVSVSVQAADYGQMVRISR